MSIEYKIDPEMTDREVEEELQDIDPDDWDDDEDFDGYEEYLDPDEDFDDDEDAVY